MLSSSSSLGTFPAALVITSSSLCLASSLALLSLVYLHGDIEEEYSEAGVLAHGAATLLMRWATCSAVASAAGLVGVLFGRLVLLRAFAVIAAFDLLCTTLLLLVLLLLTYVPTLSAPFSTFLCGALTGGSPDEGLNLWGGLEVCEDNWRVVMGIVSAGAAVAIGLRAWATSLIWKHYGAVARMKGPGRLEADEWFDQATMDREAKDNLRRMKQVTESHTRAKRSSTLPILLGLNNRERPMPRHHGRFKSHSVSGGRPSTNEHRPQLVLVPVFVDAHESGPRSSSSSSAGGSRSSSFAASDPPFYSSPYSTPSTSRSSSCSSTASRPYHSTYAPFTCSEPDSISPECSPKQRTRSRSSDQPSTGGSTWREEVLGQNALGLSLEEVRCR